MAPKKSRTSKTSKRAAETSSSALRDEEELLQRDPECAEALLISPNVHQWLRFDRNWVLFNQYSRNLYFVMKKQFELARYVDWEPLETVGLAGPVRELLTQHFEHNGQHYRFTDWERLFNIRVPVFKELCYEFHATLGLKNNPESINDQTFMRFRLGGEPRSMSMKELAMCLGIYTPEELSYDCFDLYLWSGARVLETHTFIEDDFWEELSEKEYSPSGVSHKDMNDVRMRIIHRFLAHTLQNRRENREKITRADIWYLRQIRERIPVNIPFGVASYLSVSSAGVKDKSPISGGHFVTLIARSFGINFGSNSRLIEVDVPQKSLGYLMYNATEAVAKDKKGRFIPFAEPPQQPEQQQPPPQQRRQRAPQPVVPEHQPQPSLYDLMQSIQGIQLGTNRIEDTLTGFQNEVNYRMGNIEYRSD